MRLHLVCSCFLSSLHRIGKGHLSAVPTHLLKYTLETGQNHSSLIGSFTKEQESGLSPDGSRTHHLSMQPLKKDSELRATFQLLSLSHGENLPTFFQAHGLTKSLPLSSSLSHNDSQRFLTMHQDHLLASVPLHKGTEVAMMRRLRQIFHEARSGVAIVVAERSPIRSFPGRQMWKRESIFKADVHCSGSSPHSIARLPLPKNVYCWMSLPRPRVTIEAQECGYSTMRRTY